MRVFFCMEDRERKLDSPIEKIMMQLTGFADELEREKARQRTYDARQRKARAGHVTGGRVFGYPAAGLFDEGEPFFDLLWNRRSQFEGFAKSFYGAPAPSCPA